MKTFDQLAQAAYEAHQKASAQQYSGYTPVPWAELSFQERKVFEAVARQLWAEFSAIH
jgi:hypothetical protein